MIGSLTAQRNIGVSSSHRPIVRHIILSLIDSGLAVFYQSFSSETIEPNLFSALVMSISLRRRLNSDYVEVAESEIFQVEQHQANICYGKYLAGIAISESTLDAELMMRLKRFIETFEFEYEFLLVNWHGDVSFFDQEWAATLLSQYLNPHESQYRLHTDAMSRSDNGREFRIVLLIRRFVGKSNFDLASLQRLIMKELQVPEDDTREFLFNLEKHGIIVPIVNPS